MDKKLISSLISSCVLLGGVSSVASAIELEEILVTAQKREQSANEIGMSITAYSGDTLKELAVEDITDLAAITPGLTYNDVGAGTPVYTMRGVGFNESSLQAASTVGVYNDEVAIPFPIMTGGPLLDIERVEILKGPQGTLYGRNSTGGGINYIANKPTEEFEAGISLGYGRFETIDAEGYISGALSNAVRARLAFRTTQSGEGWQKSVSREDELGEQDRIGVRLQLEADFSDSFDALLALNWWEDNSDTLAPQFMRAAYQTPGNMTVSDIIEDYIKPTPSDNARRADWTVGRNFTKNTEMQSAFLTLKWQINEDLKLTTLTGVSHFEDNGSVFNRDGFSGVPLEDPRVPPLIPATAVGFTPSSDHLNNSYYSNDAEIDSFSQELRLSGENDTFSWIAGVYYSNDEVLGDRPQSVEFSTNTNNFAGVPAFGIQEILSLGKQEGESWAVFGHTEWYLTDDISLTVGLRHTRDEKDFEGCTKDVHGGLYFIFSALLGAGNEPGGCVSLNSEGQAELYKGALNESSTSGKVAVDWNLDDDTLLYLSYSRGFKSGSFPTLAANLHIQLEPVVQEQLDAVEAGFKTALMDGNAQLNGAAFYYDYTDKQMLTKILTGFGSLFTLANVPESEVKGAEIELQWQAIDGLFVSLAGSYVDTEIKKFSGYTQQSTQAFDLAGSEFPLTPQMQLLALVNYEWPVRDGLMAFLGGDLSYSDSFQTDFGSAAAPLDPIYEVDETTVVGLRAGLRSTDDAWSLMFWGRNVTDEFVASNVYKSVDNIIRAPGMPATYGVTASYNW
jgi:outer membrane receptor protein involved in Fe transport